MPDILTQFFVVTCIQRQDGNAWNTKMHVIRTQEVSMPDTRAEMRAQARKLNGWTEGPEKWAVGFTSNGEPYISLMQEVCYRKPDDGRT